MPLTRRLTADLILAHAYHALRGGNVQPFISTLWFGRQRGTSSEDGLKDSSHRVRLEALRFARLSGFFICARLVVDAVTDVAAVKQLHARINDLDVDGVLISCSAPSSRMADTVSRLRRQLLTRHWTLLSQRLGEASLSEVGLVPGVQQEPMIAAESARDHFGEEAPAG